jgi:Flp pilus assembly protein TadG
MNRVVLYLKDEDGAGTAEFVLILPPLLMFLFGFIHLCMMMYTSSQLHWATEEAARCASVRMECRNEDASDPTDLITAWANSHYKGFTTAAFDYDAAGSCGHQVTATSNYKITIPLYSRTFNLNSSACFP